MKSEFDGHNYIVVYKHDDKCKIKPFKTLDKARKYYDKKMYECASTMGWRTVALMDTMGREIKRFG